MYATGTHLRIWPLPCVWTATPAPWRSVGPACSRGGSGRGSWTCHRAEAAHSCPLNPLNLIPPWLLLRIHPLMLHIMTPGSWGSWFQHPKLPTPPIKKTKNKKKPQLFPLNLLLLLYLFLMLFSDFNTCFKNSPALRRPQILSLLQLVPDECFTCFHCCLRSTWKQPLNLNSTTGSCWK